MPLHLREESLAWRAIDDRVVLLDLRASEYLQMNETGSLLFLRLADDGAEVEDLVEVLHDAYDVDQETAREDVVQFIATLRERDLLER